MRIYKIRGEQDTRGPRSAREEDRDGRVERYKIAGMERKISKEVDKRDIILFDM